MTCCFNFIRFYAFLASRATEMQRFLNIIPYVVWELICMYSYQYTHIKMLGSLNLLRWWNLTHRAGVNKMRNYTKNQTKKNRQHIKYIPYHAMACHTKPNWTKSKKSFRSCCHYSVFTFTLALFCTACKNTKRQIKFCIVQTLAQTFLYLSGRNLRDCECV